MSYVIASYGITGIVLVAYGLHLHRERRRLRRAPETVLDRP